MIIINFKKHKKVLKLAKICSDFRKIIIALQPKDIFLISKKIKSPIYSQYSNSKYNALLIKKSGAKGILLNHSDNPITNSVIKKKIKKCKKIKLKTIVCCSNLKRAKQIDKLRPDYIAIEPKELIGGKKSVTNIKPNLIKKIVNQVNTPVLCGAGIHTKKDVSKAIKLGAKGVLISSAVVKAKNPKKKIKELFMGLKR
ncbi:triose-phosphate isomerase [Candidatus Woesearchaeota archaeon]|nr:triose-phosphate isomerase [Candidatus Woesearchaeota archaeon]